MKRIVSMIPHFALFAVLAMLAACPNPVQEAKSPELKAQALYADFTLAEETAARLIQSPQVPDSVKASIQSAERSVAPLAEAMEAKRDSIAALRISKPEDVPAALLALDELIRKTQPLLVTLQSKTRQQP